MLVKQNADGCITIRRFDTQENVTFEKGTEVDLDMETAEYLIKMRCFDQSGNLLSDFTSSDPSVDTYLKQVGISYLTKDNIKQPIPTIATKIVVPLYAKIIFSGSLILTGFLLWLLLQN
jgi:hypothetical protein